jgi:putative FmdB family regulatory protein
VPLYEYKCKQCGAVFEVLQRHSAKPITTHKDCGGPVERLISPSALHFKGSGFYITDYAKGSNSSPRTSAKDTPKADKPAEALKTESAAPAAPASGKS